MQSERRDLEYFGNGLTDEQVVEKKRMLRESAQAHPEIAEYFRELACDFCVRFPEDANFADAHFLQFVQMNLLYNQKKLYQVTKARLINEKTQGAVGDFIFSNSMDLEGDERDIFDFSNVM